jgi:hypothetical protein
MSKFYYGTIPYQGSKRKSVGRLAGFFPLDDLKSGKITDFYDLYGGGGSVSLYVYHNFPNVTVHYNDLNENLYNMFKHMTDHTIDDIRHQVSLIPFNAEQFKIQNKIFHDSPNGLVNYLYNVKYSFRGLPSSRMPNMRNGKLVQYKLNLPHLINLDSKRFKTSCRDSISILKELKDKDNILLYLDPPYLGHGINNESYVKTSTTDINHILESMETTPYIICNLDFCGHTYHTFKDYMNAYYPSNFALNTNRETDRKYYNRYEMVVSNFNMEDI